MKITHSVRKLVDKLLVMNWKKKSTLTIFVLIRIKWKTKWKLLLHSRIENTKMKLKSSKRKICNLSKKIIVTCIVTNLLLLDEKRVELLTFCLQGKRATNYATRPTSCKFLDFGFWYLYSMNIGISTWEILNSLNFNINSYHIIIK